MFGQDREVTDDSALENFMDFDRTNTSVKHPKRFNGQVEQHFEIEIKMAFTSDRKRMSILVRDPKDNKLKLYIKGADSEVKKRLKIGA